jgi:hypothetical protein
MGEKYSGRPAMSTRVDIVTEGQTETNFIKNLLVPHFSSCGITLIPYTLRVAASQYPNPELINDSEQTSPSKRILQCVPEYDKPTDGIEITEKIGLAGLRKKCRHFNGWIEKLENLPSTVQPKPYT